jgi:hypothetical protein
MKIKPADPKNQYDCTTPLATILPVFGTMKLTNPSKWFLIFHLAACGLVMAACSGPISSPTGTPTLPATETPTPTIIWFPPTYTPNVLPTQPATPTQEYHPGIGELILADSFDQPEVWNTANSDQASASVTRNRLILTISGPGPLSIASLRSQPEVSDFYAEAMADINLCSGKDQYGMLFRASGSAEYYRFVINCSGQLRVERLRAGETYPLLDWLSSGDAPSGAPAQVKLGVWAAGQEIRLFLNDHYQTSLLDPVFSSGTIGFFIRANDQSPVTVSFSNLSVYSVAFIPTPVTVPSWTPVPTSNP